MVSEQSFKEARKPIGKGRKEVTPTAIRESPIRVNVFHRDRETHKRAKQISRK